MRPLLWRRRMRSFEHASERGANRLRFRFGSTFFLENPQPLDVPAGLLRGPAADVLGWPAASAERSGEFTLFHSQSGMGGHWTGGADADIEEATRSVYEQLLRLVQGRHLYRIWNFVPRINATEHGLENYRRFCRARSLAFEQHFGDCFQQRLPAASAVGLQQGALSVAFLAGRNAPDHFENPLQVPAFEYPSDYGPRAPSFARATAVQTVTGRRVFISGTAAIRNHRSVADGDLGAQVACTIENLEHIGAATGVGSALGSPTAARVFRVYLRRQADQAVVAQLLSRDLLRSNDIVQYVEADICRSELLIEIEATIDERLS